MAEAQKRAHRHPKYKTSYRIKNWSEYEKFLDLWKDDDLRNETERRLVSLKKSLE